MEKKIIDPKEKIPHGQRVTNGWPILDLGIKPDISLADYQLTVEGAVEKNLCLSSEEIFDLPSSLIIADWHCVTTWSMLNNEWQGVLLNELCQLVKPLDLARFVVFESYDGYTTNIPIELMYEEDSLLVWGRNVMHGKVLNGYKNLILRK